MIAQGLTRISHGQKPEKRLVFLGLFGHPAQGATINTGGFQEMKRLGFVLLMVAIALTLGGNALAQGCSNATFHGNYGFTVNGTINPPGITIYISGVQMIHADGKGNLKDTEAIVIDGVPLVDAPPSYFSEHIGTYTVNSNCTGLAFLTNVPFGGVNFITLSFVMDSGGKQVRMLGVPPFDSGGTPRTVTSVGEKVGQ
jgi:hypothetical protein